MSAGLFDHVGPADGLDSDPPAVVPHPDAQPVALDELAPLVGDVVGHFRGVETAVNVPRERLDLRVRLLDARGGPDGAELVVLAGVPGHLERVVQIGRVHPRVVRGVLEDLQNAQRLLVGCQDGREEDEVIGEVGGRDRAGFAGAGGHAAVRFQQNRSRRCGLEYLPQHLVVALPAAAASVQPDLVDVFLTRQLEEPLRGPQPDGAGGGVDCLERAVEELLVEFGRRERGAGQFPGGLERVLDLPGVPGSGVVAPARAGVG